MSGPGRAHVGIWTVGLLSEMDHAIKLEWHSHVALLERAQRSVGYELPVHVCGHCARERRRSVIV
jgi:hypothetical protein